MQRDINNWPSNSNPGGKSSAELFEHAKEHLVDGYSRPLVREPYPSYLSHGRGCWAVDVDGNRYVDFTNNFGALIHGYSHPEIVEAISSQASRATCSTMPTALEAELADILSERLPSVDRIRFSNTGTEAVMLSLKMARAITGRAKIAKIEGGYHGQYELLESSFQPTPAEWGSPTVPTAARRNSGTPDYMLDQLVPLPCNELESTRTILKKNKDDLAAIIVDPMQLQLGYGKPEVEYLQMIRDEASRLGIILIFDEVVAFRNGRHGTQGKVGVMPDITVIGKFIGGGLPIGAVGGPEHIMSVFKLSGEGPRILHSGTFSGNPLTLAAGIAAMRLLTDEVFERFEMLSDRLCQSLSSVLDAHGVDARLEQYCTGSTKLVFGSEPIRNWRDLYAYYQKHQRSKITPIQEALWKRGVMASRLSFLMSSPMREPDVDFVIDAFAEAVRELAPQLRGDAVETLGAGQLVDKNALT